MINNLDRRRGGFESKFRFAGEAKQPSKAPPDEQISDELQQEYFALEKRLIELEQRIREQAAP